MAARLKPRLDPIERDIRLIIDQEMGEEARALVIAADPNDPPTAEELNAFCRETLAGYKCPRGYEFVDDIGRTAMGKVNKKALRQRFWPTDRTIGG